MTVAPRVFLLDVEGTIAPITLVSEQLFPYARAHFPAFLQAHSSDPAVQSDLALLAEESRTETDPDVPRMPLQDPPISPQDSGAPSFPPSHAGRVRSSEAALAYLIWLMDRDRKSTALKSLQGRIWKAGFESGELKGTLFPDVPPALARWSTLGCVAIYSSGSTSAQQLLFRYSTFGDLSALIAAYFDTRTGPKTAPASYAAIAAALAVDPHDVCFFSDVVRELDPAREAGMQTRLAIRKGNAPVENANGHSKIESFDEIL
ncbi:MAG: acireductone synthase [Terracidiphilus sp.]